MSKADEMEIEVGEYIRTKTGDITKIKKYYQEPNLYECENGMIIDTENNIGLHISDITKHSKNIIDLIEVGDYVNGGKITKKVDNILYINNIELKILYEIKTIVTKEQFEQNVYRLEE